MTNKTIFSVRDRAGAWVTQTVHGQRASCTHSAAAAAEALASKLHPNKRTALKLVDNSQAGVRVFELEVLQ